MKGFGKEHAVLLKSRLSFLHDVFQTWWGEYIASVSVQCSIKSGNTELGVMALVFNPRIQEIEVGGSL